MESPLFVPWELSESFGPVPRYIIQIFVISIVLWLHNSYYICVRCKTWQSVFFNFSTGVLILNLKIGEPIFLCLTIEIILCLDFFSANAKPLLIIWHEAGDFFFFLSNFLVFWIIKVILVRYRILPQWLSSWNLAVQGRWGKRFWTSSHIPFKPISNVGI
jgi:hypothetical protein